MAEYKRPYLPSAPAKPPDTPVGRAEVNGRHPLPDDKSAAVAVARYVVQVWAVATIGVLLVRVCSGFAPLLTVLLLVGGGVLLSAAAFFKWVWVGRTSRLPLLTVLSLLTVAPCVVGSLTAVTSPLVLMGGVFALVTVVGVARVAWWADGATMWLDARETVGMAGGALILAGVAAVPPTLGSLRVLLVLTYFLNAAFGLAVLFTYVGYVLANPAHPRDTITAARARWQRIVRNREPGHLSPFVFAGGMCVIGVLGGAFMNAATVGTLGMSKPLDPSDLDVWNQLYERAWWALAFFLCLALPLAAGVWRDRRAFGRALAVYLLYTGAPTPGVYTPPGHLGTVRRRQLGFAVVVFANVALVRMSATHVDAFVVRHAADIARLLATDEDVTRRSTTLLLAACYALGFALPLAIPAVAALYGSELRVMHNLLEETTPTDLYPAKEGQK